jgi:HK97 family phage major capsid protein
MEQVMDTANVTVTMSPEFEKLMEVFSFISGIKKGSRNNAEDQMKIQKVHDLTKEMGVVRDCTKSATKTNSRFSKDDMAMVEKIHDHAVNLGAECGPEGEGNYPGSKTAKREDVNPDTGKEKYGNVEFADEKNKKYPIDTEAHIRSAWNYINKPKNSDKYSVEVAAKIKSKIVAAWKKEIDKDGPPSAEKKSTSIQDLVQDLHEAWYQAWQEDDETVQTYPDDADKPTDYGYVPCPMVQDILDDSIVIKIKGKEWKVPYTVNGVYDYSFATPDKWTRVKEAWSEVQADGSLKAESMLMNFGTAVKAMSNGHIGGKCVKFSDEKNLDSTGDYFDKDTEFDAKVGMSGPIYLHHTLPVKTGKGIQRVNEKIGEATITGIDEDGVELDGVLYDELVKSHDGYMKKLLASVKKAVKAGKMGWSTGTAAHLVIREKKGTGNHIKRWPLGLDFTITPTPAGAMQGVAVEMKSFQIPEIEDEPEGASQVAVSSDASGSHSIDGSLKSITQDSKDTQMTQEEINAQVTASVKAAFAAQKAEEKAQADALKAVADAKIAEDKKIADAVDAALKSRGVRVVRKPVNAGGVKTDKAPAINEKTELGDDAFKAFNYWLKTGDSEALRDTARMNSEDADLLDPEEFKAGMKTTYNVVGPTQYQGLELVPTEVYDKIIELRDPMSIARVGGAQVIPIGARTRNFPIEKNRSGKFVIEADGSSYDPNAVQPFDKRAITAFKFTRTVGMSIEVMEDSLADLTAWWTRHVARMEALTENYYFSVGANGGASTPEGIIGGGTAAVTLASATTITASEVVQLFYKLPQPYRDNPSFMCNGTTEGIIRALSGNWFQFQPTPSGSGGGNYPMGSDWIISPKCKLLVASDMADFGSATKVACVGNWAEYIIAERSAMSIFRDPYSNASTGMVNFHCHFRRGGMVGITEAFQYATAKTS